MALVIQTATDGSADYTIRTKLDGVDYGMRFMWNEREARWYLSILDTGGDVIVASIKLVANFPLLFKFQSDANVPPGELLVVDQSNAGAPNAGAPPGLDDFGDGRRCQLIYLQATTADG